MTESSLDLASEPELLAAGPVPTEVFDVCGPLPQRTTVLEASAGTGKTFTIAALATRYVAEGVADLSELMLITFGRAATSELRDRVRERLVATERSLRDPAVRSSSDALLRHLAAVDDVELARRRARLTRALAQFDAATIATTHGFCQQMLATLGVAGDVDPEAVLVPDIADLVDEVIDDFYLRMYSAESEPVLSVTDARTVAKAAVSDHDAGLEPDPVRADRARAGDTQADDRDPLAQHRHRFAAAVRAEVQHRKRTRRVLHYDDLLTLLRDALIHPQTGPDAVERVRSRYRVVMVDEFQDTDQVQWEILRAAFHGHRTLILIGDPKQAIYAFRGADVFTYLAARREAHRTATLGRNWRSDEPVIAGLSEVLGRTALGPGIVVQPVDAEHHGRRLEGDAPVRLRQVTRAAVGVSGGTPAVGAVRELIYQDVAAEVVRSLRSTRLQDAHGSWRPLRPGDVAVLARRNADASAIRRALVDVGVPAVESGLSSVFGTPAAQHWLTLLTALAQPGNNGRVAAAALTPFLGWDARRLGEAPGPERDALADRVRTWSHVLAERGVPTLIEAANAEPGPDGQGLTERLLRTTTGERVLTDLRHIGQALHGAAVRQRLGTSALTEWLRTRIAGAGEDYAEEQSRRLETDAAAVQVVTIHSSKGLEFPVVHVPFAWDRFTAQTPEILRYHDDAGQRLLHVGGATDADYDDARTRHQTEELGEDLRLTYVALTRAACQVVLWWAPTRNSVSGPLTRLLLGQHPPGVAPPRTVSIPKDPVVTEAFAAIAARSAGVLAHEQVLTAPAQERWVPPNVEPAELTVGQFTRSLDTAWRRTSYSGLTSAVHEAHYAHAALVEAAGVTSEPETTGIQDEPDTLAAAGGSLVVDDALAAPGEVALEGAVPRAPSRTPESALYAVRSPMADLPGGTAFGTLTHEVLEQVDTRASDLAAELRRRCQESPLSRGLGVDPDVLAAALLPVMETPLGASAEGLTLRDVDPRDRLAELSFELPLAGGDRPTGRGSTVRQVATLLRRHLPEDDVFAPYADRLDHPDLGTERLRGYLTGSIDAVLRVRGADGTPRHLVVDYKTNRLAPAGRDLTAWHYRPAAMVEAMIDAHYPLQLLLYTAALHRFLRWRQPGYDPDLHLGGGLYLFVRGMVGPATPVVDGTPCGVMAWRPPTALVVGLSALLDGRAS